MMVRTLQAPILMAYVVAEGNGCSTLAYIGQTALACCGSSTSQKELPTSARISTGTMTGSESDRVHYGTKA